MIETNRLVLLNREAPVVPTDSARTDRIRNALTALDCFNGPRLAAVGPSGGFVLMATIGQGYAMKDRL